MGVPRVGESKTDAAGMARDSASEAPGRPAGETARRHEDITPGDCGIGVILQGPDREAFVRSPDVLRRRAQPGRGGMPQTCAAPRVEALRAQPLAPVLELAAPTSFPARMVRPSFRRVARGHPPPERGRIITGCEPPSRASP